MGTARLARRSGDELLGIIRLTYHTTTSSDPAGRPANEPTDEIEVTPEMIEAGARALCAFEIFTAGEAYWGEEVYGAMHRARGHGESVGSDIVNRVGTLE